MSRVLNSEVLKGAGFNVSKPISTVEKKATVPLKVDVNYLISDSLSFDDRTNLVNHEITVIENLLKQESSIEGLQNPFALGIGYAAYDQNPTMGEVWDKVVSNGLNPGIQELETRWANDQSRGNFAKNQILRDISSFIQDVSYGYALFSKLSTLRHYQAAIEKHGEKLKIASGRIGFSKNIKLLDALDILPFKELDSIRRIVEQERLVEKLKLQFENIKTPDPKRTIKDRINTISDKVAASKSNMPVERPFNYGYMLAVRGEDPKIFEVVIEFSTLIFGESIWGKRPGYTEKTEDNILKLIQEVSYGYAYSFHIVFLEQKLEVLSVPKNKIEEPVLEHATKQLKWSGQKNQLYDVIRKLKDQGLLENSYEELAVFIKAHVDIFNGTSLSTISRQLSRPQKLRKAKRINI